MSRPMIAVTWWWLIASTLGDAATAQFAWDVHEGKADPKSVSDWYFGITKGKVPEKKDEETQ
jgi:hypothetical protein